MLVVALVAASLIFAIHDTYRKKPTRIGDTENPPADTRFLPPRNSSSELPALPATDPPPTSISMQSANTAAPATAQPVDWLAELYPDLVRISEIENKPADSALAELVPLLASEDPAVRLAAIESIGDITISEVLPVLLIALDDAHPGVRVAALRGLSLRADISPMVTVIESALFDSEREVRIAAIEALATLESRDSVYALAALLSDQDAAIRHHAVGALGEIGGERAQSHLQQARHDPHGDIRANAAYFLNEMNLEQPD